MSKGFRYFNSPPTLPSDCLNIFLISCDSGGIHSTTLAMTGPGFFTRALMTFLMTKKPPKGLILIAPVSWFSCLPNDQRHLLDAADYITSKARTVHWWKQTWMK
eukprot:Filipodium_phascolosomae@DN2948_c0_g1_i1.p2